MYMQTRLQDTLINSIKAIFTSEPTDIYGWKLCGFCTSQRLLSVKKKKKLAGVLVELQCSSVFLNGGSCSSIS